MTDTLSDSAVDPLLLLPGLACDAAVWRDVDAALHGVETLVPDYASADTLDAMAERTLAIAPARFAVAGHSMGGRVALEVLRRAPERVTRIALLNTGFRGLERSDAGAREVAGRQRLVNLAHAEGMAAMARDWVQGMVHPERLQDRVLIEEIVAMMARKTPEQFAGQIQALINRPDATPVLETIAVPCLLMSGSHDAWSPLTQHRAMAAFVPNARVACIDEAGHMAPMERPAAVAAELASWLAS